MNGFEYLDKQLLELKKNGLYRQLREIESAQGPVANIQGKEYILFCSNNYLSIASNPAIILSCQKSLEKYGYGSGASRLVSGTMSPHLELESKFEQFFNKESATIFTSGWCANQAIITTIAQKGDLLLLDKLDHASIVDAAKESPAEFRTYRRDSISKLEKYLSSSEFNRKFIITESIFSMDGDFAKLAELVRLKEKYGALLILDEAHSIGCMGENGAGFAQEKGLLEKVDIIVATLSKAFGASGGVVAAPAIVKEFLVNRARGLIYTTAPSPVNSCAILAAMELIKNEPLRRQRLWDNANYLRKKITLAGFDTGSSESYVIPVIIKDDFKVVEISQKLFEKGLFVPAIRPPTVAPGQSRLRISLQADHTKEQLDFLCAALKSCF